MATDKNQIYSKYKSLTHMPYRCKLKHTQLALNPPKIACVCEREIAYITDNLNFPNY